MPGGEVIAALATAGADVRYILTGQRDGPAPVVLTTEEQLLLGYFRDASRELRKAALGVLLSGTAGSGSTQIASTRNAVQIIGSGNLVGPRPKK